jgi:hypothetical protein
MNIAAKACATVVGAALSIFIPYIGSAHPAPKAKVVQPPPNAPPVLVAEPSDPNAPAVVVVPPPDPNLPPAVAVVPPDPNAPAVAIVPPPDPNAPPAVAIIPPNGPPSVIVPPAEGVVEVAIAAVGPAPQIYPPCSAAITDRCIQTWEFTGTGRPGRSARRNRR